MVRDSLSVREAGVAKGTWPGQDTRLPAGALSPEACSGLGCAVTPSLWRSAARVLELLPDMPPMALSREDRLQVRPDPWTSLP